MSLEWSFIYIVVEILHFNPTSDIYLSMLPYVAYK